MYKEFRELSRADAVKALYQDMAARHRARFRSIHVCVCLRDISTRSAPSDRPGQYTDGSHRFSVLSRSRSRRTSAAPTSSSFWCPSSSSRSPTASRRSARPSLRTGPRRSELYLYEYWVVGIPGTKTIVTLLSHHCLTLHAYDDMNVCCAMYAIAFPRKRGHAAMCGCIVHILRCAGLAAGDIHIYRTRASCLITPYTNRLLK